MIRAQYLSRVSSLLPGSTSSMICTEKSFVDHPRNAPRKIQALGSVNVWRSKAGTRQFPLTSYRLFFYTEK